MRTRRALSAPHWCATAGAASLLTVDSAAGCASILTTGCWDSSAEDTARVQKRTRSCSLPHPPSAPTPPDLRFAVDAHHGRVLLARMGFLEEPSTCRFAVWDPITGDLLELPRLPRRPTADFTWKAVVLCASIRSPSSTSSSCDHLDCHRRPFLVVFVGTSPHERGICLRLLVAGGCVEPHSLCCPGSRRSLYTFLSKRALPQRGGRECSFTSDF